MTHIIILSICLTFNTIEQSNPSQQEEVLDSINSLHSKKKFKQLYDYVNAVDKSQFDQNSIYKYHYWYGESRRRQREYDSASFYFELAYNQAKSKDNFEWQTNSLDRRGSVFRARSAFDAAIVVYLKSLALKNSIEDKNRELIKSIALSHEFLGISYDRLSKFPEAIDHYKSALKFDSASNIKSRKEAILNNLGLAYFNWAKEIRTKPHIYGVEQILGRSNIIKNSLNCFYYLKRQELNTNGKIDLYQNLSAVFSELGSQDSVYYYANKSKKLILNSDASRLKLLTTYNSLGFYFLNQQKLDSARYFFNETEQRINNSKSNHDNLKMSLYSNLAIYHKHLNQYDSAYSYLSNYFILYSKNINEKSESEVNGFTELYHSENKDRQLASEMFSKQTAINAKKNTQIIAGSILFVVLGGLVFFIQRNKVIKVESKNLVLSYEQKVDKLLQEQETKALDAMIEGQEKERKHLAEELHDRLGSVLSAAKMHLEGGYDNGLAPEQFESVNKMLKQAIDDTRQISHNMLSGVLTKFGLEAALYDLKENVSSLDNLKVTLETKNLDKRLDIEKEVHLYRIVQELLSNTLRHANANKFDIKLQKDNTELLLHITDDGKGMDNINKASGIGLKNIASRAKKIGAKWNLTSSPGMGISATIILPI
ncbi:tetratricopeptide repeat-containing sensor histidine kinase [Roseivirga misakiensis]|uniref:histidine kinase n=1 Tax=Roseivirga misakiensis TaxID=1563681 RepID=A0A1E5SZ72_9BACT|nr:sensor histidine kinase [Roseivirga misakiensis]OEK04406.1 hypothetical protein BFP71_13075 [Roseivirga misakiensis]